jgi:hypothetical protein
MEIATVPTVVNVTLSSGNTEYSIVLPAGAKGIRIHTRPSVGTIRYAFNPGLVATSQPGIMTLAQLESRLMNFIVSEQTTIYFATSDVVPTVDTVEVEYWL